LNFDELTRKVKLPGRNNKQMTKTSLKTALLVEDNPGDARLLREMLNEDPSHDIALTHVGRLSEAETYLLEQRVDIILLDLGLPDAQGLEAVRRIQIAAPHIPLVVMTSLDDESLGAQALQEGAEDYLVKGQLEARWLLRALRYAIERKTMKTALFAETERARDSEGRFRDFAETGSDWYWETGPDHRFSHIAGRGRTASRDTSVIGMQPWECAADAMTEPEKWHECRTIMDRHERFRDFVYVLDDDQGKRPTITVSAKPVFDAAGQFLGYRGTARDITEEAAAERGLRAAKATAETASLAKSQFLANMSHELRTPLNAIIGFSEMLAAGMVEQLTPQQQGYVANIHEGGELLLRVINDVLDLARIDAGKFMLREEEGVELGRVTNSCIALVRGQANIGGVHLSSEIEGRVPLVIADSTRLKQICLNLLSNAIKFTDTGGSVILAVRRAESGGIALEVRDTGSGMTAAEIEVALQPFGQVDGGLARRHNGTGLGLPLARQLAELHGGSLHVDSEKGHGTAITVTLPATRVLPDIASPMDEATPLSPAAVSSQVERARLPARE
jgi:signal transduction histidine kinase/CheY-like chemotaxis protein